jgi:hypothetical protein
MARSLPHGGAEDRTMIEGLKLTVTGEDLRTLLEARVAHHERCVAHWEREKARTPDEQTEEAPLLPDEMCANEAERHEWRAEVLTFIRDHIESAETYRLSAADLEFGELLPAKPGWLEQEDYEERTRTGFALERMTKAVDGVAGAAAGLLWRRHDEAATEDRA